MWHDTDPRHDPRIYRSQDIVIMDQVRNIVCMGSAETKHGYSVLIQHPLERFQCISDSDLWPLGFHWAFPPTELL